MQIVIIGNGISGITAARFIRKLSDHAITVISGETEYFFSRTALMYVYMGHMRFQDTQPYEPGFWKKNRIDLVRSWVREVVTDTRQVVLEDGRRIAYDGLILATGSISNKFGWPGQDLERVQGLYSFQDLQTMEVASTGLQRAVIVGGGLIGVEMAEMFHSRNIPVTFLVRENSFWDIVLPREESCMINRHLLEHGIDLRLNTELREIVDDGQGRACAVITNHGERINCGFVGLTAGVSPNVHFLKNSGIDLDKGILVNDFLETNIPGIYAVGDCAQLRLPKPGRRSTEPVWYTGRMMGETVAYSMCGQKRAYDPGIWFNSAKFFDIEYQVYGDVPPHFREDQATLYWEHPDGKKGIRLVYRRDDGAILGFNLMGIRYRQEVCEKWIRDKVPVEIVLQQLSLANFDPEFFREYEPELIRAYERQTGRSLALKSKRSLDSVTRFLKAI